jgi:micrococcal nuclease
MQPCFDLELSKVAHEKHHSILIFQFAHFTITGSELRDRLLASEASAKARLLGLWSQANPVMPWDYRKGGRAAAPGILIPSPKKFSFPSIKSRPNRDFGCKDFDSQAEAQRMLDAYPNDPFQLDLDWDGIVCESLRK